MEKIVALDVGSKTIGLATSSGVIAVAGPTLRFEEWNFGEGIAKLVDYLNVNPVDIIVVGYPKNMDNTIGERAEMVDYVIEELLHAASFLCPEQIIKIDERRTTKMARSIMIEAGLSRARQKAGKDSLAAQLILEQYLNSRQNGQ